ncbi:hypothetical protein [Robiginitalea marina]|uniref:Potassium transporter KefB n=1 Tax=Robiginitalea marina TaxID=2954105 RepID=A0ABT1AW50_9FLAO|nr:hypothetical protein [Robiginitalea marina]MCO5723433.1 hypothetical protein [Robiginitalea marina]
MAAELEYTNRSYQLCRWILLLLALSGAMALLNLGPFLYRWLLGLPIVLSGMLGLAGTYYVLKGIHEPLTERKVIALTVNLAMAVLVIAILVSNTAYG